jgi:hypothetical protein
LLDRYLTTGERKLIHITNTNKPIDFPRSELDEDSIAIYGDILRGKYKHYCCEFDYLPIDEHCFEFKFCLCYEGEEVKQLQDNIKIPGEDE